MEFLWWKLKMVNKNIFRNRKCLYSFICTASTSFTQCQKCGTVYAILLSALLFSGAHNRAMQGFLRGNYNYYPYRSFLSKWIRKCFHTYSKEYQPQIVRRSDLSASPCCPSSLFRLNKKKNKLIWHFLERRRPIRGRRTALCTRTGTTCSTATGTFSRRTISRRPLFILRFIFWNCCFSRGVTAVLREL